jgi:hypothetical protein
MLESRTVLSADIYSTTVNTVLNVGLVNGTFESGDIQGWTAYESAGGSIGGTGFPNVVRQDTNGDGFLSRAAQFRVAGAGGGIRQDVLVSDTTVHVRVDVAATARANEPDAGIVELWLGDVLLDRHAFAPLAAGQFQRQTLRGTVENLRPGLHEVRLQLSRASATSSSATAHHLVDNWHISGQPLGVLANDDLPLPGPNTPLLISAPSHGDLELRDDGSLRYRPDTNFVGNDSFAYLPTSETNGLKLFSVDTAADALVTIDAASGAITTIGALGHNTGVIDLAHDGTNLFALNARGTRFELLAIDTITGAVQSAVQLRFGQALRTIKGLAAVDGELYVVFSHSAGYCGDACGAAHVLGRVNKATGQITELANYRDVDGGFNHDFDALATDNQNRILGIRFAEGFAIQTYVLGFSPPRLTTLGEAHPAGASVNDAVFVGDQHYLLSTKAPAVFRYDPQNVGYSTIVESVMMGSEASALSGLAFSLDQQPLAQTVQLHVLPADAPASRDDVYQATEDQSLTVLAAQGLLHNDAPFGTAATLEITRGPLHGSLDIDQDGAFRYAPDSDVFGTDVIQYRRVGANQSSNVATVLVHVTPTADAPRANDDAYDVIQERSIAVIASYGVLANDRDPDGGRITAELVSAPAHGQLQLLADGSFTYEPAAGFVGADTFRYQASDGTLRSPTVTVRLTVAPPPPPTAQGDRFVTLEDSLLTVESTTGLLANDQGFQDLRLFAQLVTDVQHGQLALQPDGSFIYTPNHNFFGTDRFSYQTREGELVSEAVEVEIMVDAVADSPQANFDEYNVPASGLLRVDAERGVLSNDRDADSDQLVAELITGTTAGTLQLRTDGSFDYTSDATFRLTDQFTYRATDGSLFSEPVTVLLRADAPRILVGNHRLQPDLPDQTVQIFVEGGHAVAGSDLFAMVGDGGPELIDLDLAAGVDAPAITHVDFKTGTIFAGLSDAARDLGSIPQVANWSITAAEGGSVSANGLLVTLTIDTTGFLEGNWPLALGNILPQHPFGPFNSGFAGRLAHVANGSITIDAVQVVGRHLFYNNSAWDGNSGAANVNDDLAIASDKVALLPGQKATRLNYSNYNRGINGVIVDVANLRAPELLTASDFTFRVGRSNQVSNWASAARPSFSIRPGEGVDGSDRITLIWPDSTITQQWIEVTLLPTAANRLPRADRFYFGNAIGETGDSGSNTLVNAVDVIAARDNQRGPFDQAAIDDPYDFNRDRKVTAADVILARDHQVGLLAALPLITPQPTPLAAPAVDASFAERATPRGAFGSQPLEPADETRRAMATVLDHVWEIEERLDVEGAIGKKRTTRAARAWIA